jgi:hypothetical protein
MQKGFKCLEISKGRIYVSHNVISDESVFPFASLHSTAGACYHSDVLLVPTTISGDNYFTNESNVSTLPVVSASNFPVQALPDFLPQDADSDQVYGPPSVVSLLLLDPQRTISALPEPLLSRHHDTGPTSVHRQFSLLH